MVRSTSEIGARILSYLSRDFPDGHLPAVVEAFIAVHAPLTDDGGRLSLPSHGPGPFAKLLRLPGRALEAPALERPDRKHHRHGSVLSYMEKCIGDLDIFRSGPARTARPAELQVNRIVFRGAS